MFDRGVNFGGFFEIGQLFLSLIYADAWQFGIVEK